VKSTTHRFLTTIAAVLWLAPFVLAGCTAGPREEADPAYLEEIAKWRESRVENLKKPTGWLTLAGLHWLEEGDNTFGADSSNTVVFPAGKAPGVMGKITVEGGTLRVEIAPGADVFHDGRPVSAMELRHDQEGEYEPTVLSHGTLTWHVIARGDRLGVRVKDSASRTLAEFEGIECFPPDPRWRIEGVLEAREGPRTIEVPNVLGGVTREPSPGSLAFEIRGKTYRLDAVADEDDDALFVIFGDATSGKETYGGGRYLAVERPGADGKAVIDFNKAYNPPCVFTPYATCPLPPPQNVLPVAVRAGEKAYGKPGH
jgi:hypothetical protein